ncbi:DOMON domain-containing protein [Psidium guajava]|nr:DOMON domain-containing protein [Psidium guajava]
MRLGFDELLPLKLKFKRPVLLRERERTRGCLTFPNFSNIPIPIPIASASPSPNGPPPTSTSCDHPLRLVPQPDSRLGQ